MATQLIQQYLSDELGRLYAAEYFSEAAKADVEEWYTISLTSTKTASVLSTG